MDRYTSDDFCGESWGVPRVLQKVAKRQWLHQQKEKQQKVEIYNCIFNYLVDYCH